MGCRDAGCVAATPDYESHGGKDGTQRREGDGPECGAGTTREGRWECCEGEKDDHEVKEPDRLIGIEIGIEIGPYRVLGPIPDVLEIPT